MNWRRRKGEDAEEEGPVRIGMVSEVVPVEAGEREAGRRARRREWGGGGGEELHLVVLFVNVNFCVYVGGCLCVCFYVFICP